MRALERAGSGAGRDHAALAGNAGADTLLHVHRIERGIKLPGADSDRAGDVIVRRAGGKHSRRQHDSDYGAHVHRSTEGAVAGKRLRRRFQALAEQGTLQDDAM